MFFFSFLLFLSLDLLRSFFFFLLLLDGDLDLDLFLDRDLDRDLDLCLSFLELFLLPPSFSLSFSLLCSSLRSWRWSRNQSSRWRLESTAL